MHDYDKALKDYPANIVKAGKYYGKASNCLGREEYEIALILLDEGLKVAPETASIFLIDKSFALDKLNRVKEARECLKKAKKLDSEAEKTKEIRKKHFESIPDKMREEDLMKERSASQEQKSKALSIVTLASIKISRVPESVGSFMALNENSLNEINSALDLMETQSIGWLYFSKALINLGRYEEAGGYLDTFEFINDDKTKLIELKDELLTNILDLTEENFLLCRHLELKGRAYKLIEDFNSALNCYDEALKLNPDDILVLQRKLELLNTMGKIRDAMKIMEKIQQIKIKRIASQFKLKKGTTNSKRE